MNNAHSAYHLREFGLSILTSSWSPVRVKSGSERWSDATLRLAAAGCRGLQRVNSRMCYTDAAGCCRIYRLICPSFLIRIGALDTNTVFKGLPALHDLLIGQNCLVSLGDLEQQRIFKGLPAHRNSLIGQHFLVSIGDLDHKTVCNGLPSHRNRLIGQNCLIRIGDLDTP